MSTLRKNSSPANEIRLPFGRKNYFLLAIGTALIFLGFVLMATEPFIDATKFSLSLYVSPFLIIGGFAELIYAILASPGKPSDTTNSDLQS